MANANSNKVFLKSVKGQALIVHCFQIAMPTVLKDPIFATGTDEWEEQHYVQLNKLVQRAGDDPFATLRKCGWDGTGPVVALVATVDSGTKKVTRSDYVTGGLVYQFTGAVRGLGGYKPPPATWKEGTNVRISFAVKGEMLTWGCDAAKNVTQWYKLRDLDAGVQFTSGRADKARNMNAAQLATLGMDMDEWMGNLRVRFTLQHGTLGTMHLSCSVLHSTSVVMPAWAADWVKKPEAIPGLVLKPRGKEVRHAVVPWIPLEEPGQKIGLGRLPLLVMPPDVTEVTAANFPDRKELGRAVAGHLRRATAVAHAKDGEDLVAWLGRQAPKDVNQTVKVTWPEDRPRPGAGGGDDLSG